MVVGVDGSPASSRALRWAAREAGLRGAELTVAYVFDSNRHEVDLRRETYSAVVGAIARTVVDGAVAIARTEAPGLRIRSLPLFGAAAATLVNAAERGATAVRQQRAIRRPGPRRRFGFPPPPKRAQVNAQNGKKRTRGLNENYGRELLELHTLGVEGGYTQKDVIEVARAFTGWTIDRGGTFRFVAAVHDTGEKIVLGHKIKGGGGIEDGETVLDILAAHPATAHHIAYQLAQRLVADEPPAALVDRAAARFRMTNGDLREVVRTIVTSPEFLAATVRDAKFKTPFTLVVSTMRTTGATVSDTRALVQTLQQMGQPLYMCQPPTGYHNTADAWVSAGGLVSRMNFATRLASGNMPGVTLPANPPNELALRLGSPEFQRF